MNYQSEPTNTTIIDGRLINYGEGITNRATIHFSFRDRIRILFGAKVTVTIDTYIEEKKATILGTESKISVQRRIRKSKGVGMTMDFNMEPKTVETEYSRDTEQDRGRNGYYGIDNE